MCFWCCFDCWSKWNSRLSWKRINLFVKMQLMTLKSRRDRDESCCVGRCMWDNMHFVIRGILVTIQIYDSTSIHVVYFNVCRGAYFMCFMLLRAENFLHIQNVYTSSFIKVFLQTKFIRIQKLVSEYWAIGLFRRLQS